jgi:hypothetical protein
VDLEIQFKRLSARLTVVERRFSDFQRSMTGRLEHQHWMFLEGLISATWQYWGHFCRSVVIESALGARTAGGTVLQPCAASWQEVSYIAVRATTSRPAEPGGTNSVQKKEPTWGDVNKLLTVLSLLKPANQAQLSQSFGSSSYIGHVQVIRNAAAHRHHENTAEVLALRPYYVVSRLRHPCETVFWIEQKSQNLAFLCWLDDMRMIGDLAVQ